MVPTTNWSRNFEVGIPRKFIFLLKPLLVIFAGYREVSLPEVLFFIFIIVDLLTEKFLYLLVALADLSLKNLIQLVLMDQWKQEIFPSLLCKALAISCSDFLQLPCLKEANFSGFISPLQMALIILSPVSPVTSFTTTSNRKLSNLKYFCIFREVSAAWYSSTAPISSPMKLRGRMYPPPIPNSIWATSPTATPRWLPTWA